MADQRASDATATVAHCPWCSADLPTAHGPNCPSCGATLAGEPERPLPGVTAVDAEAIVRAARTPTPQRRSRLLSWISGDDGSEAETPAQPGSLAPPPPEVRREILRLELEAEVANLQAEAESVVSEAEVDARAEARRHDVPAAEPETPDAAAPSAPAAVPDPAETHPA